MLEKYAGTSNQKVIEQKFRSLSDNKAYEPEKAVAIREKVDQNGNKINIDKEKTSEISNAALQLMIKAGENAYHKTTIVGYSSLTTKDLNGKDHAIREETEVNGHTYTIVKENLDLHEYDGIVVGYGEMTIEDENGNQYSLTVTSDQKTVLGALGNLIADGYVEGMNLYKSAIKNVITESVSTYTNLINEGFNDLKGMMIDKAHAEIDSSVWFEFDKALTDEYMEKLETASQSVKAVREVCQDSKEIFDKWNHFKGTIEGLEKEIDRVIKPYTTK